MLSWLILCSLTIILSYILGSFPTGYLVGKVLKGIDIREMGSGSTGATNVLRTLGKGPGIFVLFIDCLKGVFSISLIYALLNFTTSQNLIPATVNLELWKPWIVISLGSAAILGHSKSIFLGFSGGKSVATSLGILLAMCWPVGLATLGVFLLVIGVSRIVSLSSITGAIAVSLFIVLFQQPLAYLLFTITGGLYVIFRHKSNIARILAGTEPKIGQKLELETRTEQV
ncbi:glycerol-3-phosphate 1-O-acyltransferase PlsY [Anabaena sp. FACHB-1237]|uniref:glycerol-3-phosphate 1-O-acyltransferase PlsY n=1 Tax=Anabaena sp. FACHB-1237 TaxID=2692769 RepID=UPI00168196A3|nr:glycerol-3-phosphate 1-O-acyltransferase PlsY [Anabaena sp. FACHB-1237]MBD2139301.1 glycerol-3-phosphate 1-O-acyltransferase PlsY [Anabaena sp. FACHB-1237]